MGNVLVKEETLTAIADSIREKNGSTAKYKPSEMSIAISEIETGNKESADYNKPVKFYGLDGELLYSYSLKEISELTELPPLPKEKGFICQGWNWTLENIKNAEREVDIAAIFITDDGATRIYVNLNKNTLNPILCFGQETAESVQVDWGDGSEFENSESYGLYVPVKMQHQYAEKGEYVIRLIPNDGAKIMLGNTYQTRLLKGDWESDDTDYAYGNTIKKIEIGEGVEGLYHHVFEGVSLERITIPKNVISIYNSLQECSSIRFVALPQSVTKLLSSAFRACRSLKKVVLSDSVQELGSMCFSGCFSLEFVSFPDSLTKWYSQVFLSCYSLETIIVPRGITSLCGSMVSGCYALQKAVLHDGIVGLETSIFDGCQNLKSIELPRELPKISNQMFNDCYALREIEISESVTEIGMNAFNDCYSLSEMKIPRNVLTIGGSAFYKCTGIQNYYFYPVVPPAITSSNIFTGISETCKIHVPKGCLDAYLTAEYWSTYADYMVEMEE